jgi:hypothetical protein
MGGIFRRPTRAVEAVVHLQRIQLPPPLLKWNT